MQSLNWGSGSCCVWTFIVGAPFESHQTKEKFHREWWWILSSDISDIKLFFFLLKLKKQKSRTKLWWHSETNQSLSLLLHISGHCSASELFFSLLSSCLRRKLSKWCSGHSAKSCFLWGSLVTRVQAWAFLVCHQWNCLLG